MLTVCGWDLQLAVDNVICQSDSCFLGSATDDAGQKWLVLHNRTPDTRAWLCAEVSIRMLEEVEAGRAAASDVFRHTLTGTVEVVSAGTPGGQSRDRCVRCADLPESWISGDASSSRPLRGTAPGSIAATRSELVRRRPCGAAKSRALADAPAPLPGPGV